MKDDKSKPKIELSPSSRATCRHKNCKKKIQVGEIRLAIPYIYQGNPTYKYYHIECAWDTFPNEIKQAILDQCRLPPKQKQEIIKKAREKGILPPDENETIPIKRITTNLKKANIIGKLNKKFQADEQTSKQVLYLEDTEQNDNIIKAVIWEKQIINQLKTIKEHQVIELTKMKIITAIKNCPEAHTTKQSKIIIHN